MPKKPVAEAETVEATACKAVDEGSSPSGDSDSAVRLLRGYWEDRALRTGAIVETQVYPPGTIIPLSEAIARHIDDYVVVVDQPSSTEFVSGPMMSVRDHKLFGE